LNFLLIVEIHRQIILQNIIKRVV